MDKEVRQHLVSWATQDFMQRTFRLRLLGVQEETLHAYVSSVYTLKTSAIVTANINDLETLGKKEGH